MNITRGLAVLCGLVFFVVAILWLASPFRSPGTAVRAAKVILAKKRLSERNPSTSSSLAEACRKKGIPFPPRDVRILVDKSEYRLYLYSGDAPVKTYPISLGSDPVNDKVREGDGRTPEGEFYVCQKAVNPAKSALGSRWMRLSYPNKEDAARGLAGGLINSAIARDIQAAIDARTIPPQRTPLGGGIGIHGGSYDRYGVMVPVWTAGCVGLYDRDIEEFYEYVPVGTRVVVRK